MNECRMRVLLANSSYQPGVRYIYKREGKEFEYGKRFDGRTTKIGRIKGSNIKPANLQKTLEELKQQGFQVEQNVWQAIQAALA